MRDKAPYLRCQEDFRLCPRAAARHPPPRTPYNDNRKSKFKVFRRQIRDLQANSLTEFVDFCCNDIVSKSLIDFLVRLNHQPRKGLLPFRHTIIIINTSRGRKRRQKKTIKNEEIRRISTYHCPIYKFLLIFRLFLFLFGLFRSYQM